MKQIEKKRKVNKEYKALAKNSLYSFLHSYSAFIFSIVTSFIMARIISQAEWGFLIIALSYITIVGLILIFLPPSLGFSFNYYIPRYRSLNKNKKLKTFIKNSIYIRLIFVIILFLISVIVFVALAELFQINLKTHINLLYMLCPLIIIDGIDKILTSLTRSLNKFNIDYILLIMRSLINIGGLLVLIFNRNLVSIEAIAFIIFLSYIIPFLFDIFIVFRIYDKIEETEEESLSFKEVFVDLVKYGSNISLKEYLSKFYRELQTQLISILSRTETVTGYNIALNYSKVSNEAVISFNTPLIISFSSLEATKKVSEIQKIYTNLFQYTVFMILIVTGCLYFVVDIFLFLVYTEDYLVYSLIVKLLLISIIFNIKISFFFSLLKASDKYKYVTPIYSLVMFIKITFFVIGLIFFNVSGGIIGVIIANVIIFILLTFLTQYFFKIKMNYLKSFLQYIIFFVSLGLSILVSELFFKNISSIILTSLNLIVFERFDFLSFIFFLLLFLSLYILLKIFTKSDIENLELFFRADTFINKVMRKILRFLKRIMRK